MLLIDDAVNRNVVRQGRFNKNLLHVDEACSRLQTLLFTFNLFFFLAFFITDKVDFTLLKFLKKLPKQLHFYYENV